MTQVAYYGLVLVVHPSVPANGLREFEAMLRARPGEATITSAGVGTPTHLTAELFRARAGVEFAHVPFQGAAPAHTALLAGQVQAMFHNPVLAVPAIQAGRLRALATTGAARAAALPEAPTWRRRATPASSRAPGMRCSVRLRRVVALPAVRQRFAAQSLEPRWAGPEALSGMVREKLARWSEVIRRLGLRQE